MATELQVANVNAISALLLKDREKILQLGSKFLTPERLSRVLINCITRTPKLAECSVASLYRVAMACAELGLEPGGVLGHLHLVPFKGEAAIIIGYRGMMELGRRSGLLADLSTGVVHEGDHFDFSFGLDPTLLHKPKLGGSGRPIAVYAISRLTNGQSHVEVLDWPAVQTIKNRALAKAYDKEKSPWTTDEEEMARKTAVRRSFKYLPTSELLARAFEIEEDEQPEEDAPDVAPQTTTERAKASIAKHRKLTLGAAAETIDESLAGGESKQHEKVLAEPGAEG